MSVWSRAKYAIGAFFSEAQPLTEPGLLVLDGDIAASGTLVGRPDVVRDLLVLGLFDSGL
jgi:hypothetical protein